MKIRITLELDFGETDVDVTSASAVARHRIEGKHGFWYYTPENHLPLARVVAAWEIEKRFIPTVEPRG